MRTLEQSVRAFRPEDMPALRAVLAEPVIAEQYDMYQGEDGAERMLGDPFTPQAGVRLAFVDGEVAGFACAIVIPAERPWAMLRGGVRPRFQRRGIGRALHDSVTEFVRTQTVLPDVAEIAIAAWEPLEPATAMAERLGYGHDRWFWLMRRERGAGAARDGSPGAGVRAVPGRRALPGVPAPEPVWPEGVEARAFDGSEPMLRDYRDAYNDSFAEHYRFVPMTLDLLRKFVDKPGFRGDGLLLAYRDGRSVGFCRNELHATRAEIGTLGTVRAARGIGLGRALLRWGVTWIERETTLPVTLLVDGENEGALALYRSEGFDVMGTRHIWARPAPAAGAGAPA
jgi:ribosomal protein S18 acetylase RimI-like enzyme